MRAPFWVLFLVRVNNGTENVDKIKNFDFTEKKLEFFKGMLYY